MLHEDLSLLDDIDRQIAAYREDLARGPLFAAPSVGADIESPSGYALRTSKPVISNHLENEERFRTPELLKVHGVKRAINVILQGDGGLY